MLRTISNGIVKKSVKGAIAPFKSKNTENWQLAPIDDRFNEENLEIIAKMHLQKEILTMPLSAKKKAACFGVLSFYSHPYIIA